MKILSAVNFLCKMFHLSCFISKDATRQASDIRRKGTSKKSTLGYKEVYEELVNQNEILIKMTATKKDLNNLESNFDRK